MNLTTESTTAHEDCAEYRRRLWQTPISRRSMLTGTLGVAALGAAGSHMLLDHRVLEHLGTLHPGVEPDSNILIVIQQAGGNDGLNTVIPYTSERYYKRRPTLAVPADKVLRLDSTVGFHPNLVGVKRLYDQGRVAVVQGVGYDNPDMSHFQSIIAWETGDTSGRLDSGWLGRYLDTALGNLDNPLKAVSIGDSLPLAFRSRNNATPAVTSLPDFQLVTDSDGKQRLRSLRAFQAMNQVHDQHPSYAAIRTSQMTTIKAVDKLHAVPTYYQARAAYPKSDLARQLQLVAQLIHANLGTRVFWVLQDGYDDHVREMGDHAHLLGELDGAVSAFQTDMKARGWDHKIMLMTWSEFGRRVEENGDKGTDHGTAAPMLIMGGSVRGGVYGSDPVLDALDSDGNLRYGIDYRSVYRSVVEQWLHADPGPIVGNGYETIPFV